MSDFRMQEATCICKVFTTSLLSLIKVDLAQYKDAPLVVNAVTIAMGISNIIVLSCSRKIFFIAGSNNHAIAAVAAATTKDKRSASNNFLKCFFI